METFKGQNMIAFFERFHSDRDCLEYLAQKKWSSGFVCKKCGGEKFTVRKKNLARDCNRCHHVESPTAGTLFHHLRFGLRSAFGIVFEMSASTKGLSASQVSRRYSVNRETAHNFMHKVRNAMKSSKLRPLEDLVFVDEFVFGGKEDLKPGRSRDSKKKKVAAAVEFSSNGGVKRVYFKKLENYSSAELGKIFAEHICPEARVITDEWTGYKPLRSVYNIRQIKSNRRDFFGIHTIIHQVKSWLRSVFSWVHAGHIEKYLAEFSFRLNRSHSKQSIFDCLITRMMNAKPLYYKDIKISK